MPCVHAASMRALVIVVSSVSLLSFASPAAKAEDAKAYEITLKGQAFTPAELKVPAGKPFVIKVKNANDAPAEFESKDLKIEKIVAGKSEITAKVKALKPGSYQFFDEYHEEEARGTIVAE